MYEMDDDAREAPAVPREFDHLEKAVAELESCISLLEDRLSPILKPEKDNPGLAEVGVPREVSQVSVRIVRNRDKVNDQIRRIHDLVIRLEI